MDIVSLAKLCIEALYPVLAGDMALHMPPDQDLTMTASYPAAKLRGVITDEANSHCLMDSGLLAWLGCWIVFLVRALSAVLSDLQGPFYSDSLDDLAVPQGRFSA